MHFVVFSSLVRALRYISLTAIIILILAFTGSREQFFH